MLIWKLVSRVCRQPRRHSRNLSDACQIPLREWTNVSFKFALAKFGTIFDVVSDQITLVLRYVELSLLWLPWWLIVAVIGLVSWHASRHRS